MTEATVVSVGPGSRNEVHLRKLFCIISLKYDWFKNSYRKASQFVESV